MISPEQVLVELTGEDRPVTLDPPQALKMYWSNERDLRVELKITELELHKVLATRDLGLNWKTDFRGPAGNRVGELKKGRDPLPPIGVKESRAAKTMEVKSALFLMPLKGDFRAGLEGRAVTLTFDFNQDMAAKDQLGKNIRLADSPFELNPPLEMSGTWRSPRQLVFQTEFSPEDFQRRVANRKFTLASSEGVVSLAGSRIDLYQEFSLYQFKLNNFTLAERNVDGWVDFDLEFNRPVKFEDLAAALKARRAEVFPWNEETGQSEPAFEDTEVQVLRFHDDEAGKQGRLAWLRIKTGPGQLLALKVNDLPSADGLARLDQGPAPLWVDNQFAVMKTEFKVESEYPWRPYFSVTADSPLNFENLAKFIRLDPPRPFEVMPYGREGDTVQIFADFYDGPGQLTLLTGFPAQKGVLTGDRKYEIKPPTNLSRELIFTGRGRYLSPNRPLLVKLAGRNVPRVRLQAWRVYENNLPLLINVQDYDSQTKARLGLQLSKNILDRTTEVENPSGGAFERLLDLDGLLETPRGAYLLKITPLDEKGGGSGRAHYDYADYYHNTERYLPIVISDLGLAARALPGRLALWVTGLGSGRPQGSCLVRVYDRANQVLAEGRTDAGGLFSAEVDVAQAVFATVEKDGDFNYLTFGDRPRSENDSERYGAARWRDSSNSKWYGGDGGYLSVETPKSAYGPMREPLSRGYEAFVFAPRNLFKPGETVPVKALVRDKNLLPPEKPFPVLWRVIDPDDRVLSQGRAEMSRQGGVDFALEMPHSARTGSYRAEILLPEGREALGRVAFTVEDFMPPRLAVNLAPERPAYQGENPEITLTASAEYLFGALGAGLNWELDAVISEAEFKPQGWEGYIFPGPGQSFPTARQRRAVQGRLGQDGRVLVNYRPGLSGERLPNQLSLELIFGVQEDGGRWNAQRTTVKYFPRDLILGLKLPQTPVVKQSLPLGLAAVTPEGAPGVAGEVSVKISRVVNRFYNTYRYGRQYRQSVEEFLPQAETLVSLSPNGSGDWAFVPQSAGLYEITLSALDGPPVKKRFQVYGQGPDQEIEAAVGRVDLSFDRPDYRHGDQARLRVKAPFAGQLWLTVESPELLYSHSFQMSGPETEVTLPVDARVKTNAYVTATVVRPLSEDSASVRAIGLASLEIDRSLYKLNLAVEKPDRLKPSSQAPIKIKLTDAQGRPCSGEVTVALVDEGVLNLGGFASPDPWAGFTVGRHFRNLFYDLYDQLLPLEKTTVPFLIPGGGEGLSRAGLFSPFKRRQDILSIFLAAVEVGESGEALVDLDIPEYSGLGRLMVVAASGDRFASSSQQVTISRDLTAEVTPPLALAPGDTFEIPMKAFLAAEAPAEAGREVSFNLTAEGPIKLTGPTAAQFTLKPGQGHSRIFTAQAVPADQSSAAAGTARLTVESRDGLGENFRQTLEVVVRPPYPRVRNTAGQVAAEAESVIELPETGFLEGTLEASLMLARSPAIEAARAVGYLEDYPYGCLEQTLSRAWMFVTARDLLKAKYPDRAESEHIKKGLDQAVKRLATMQTLQGDMAYWPGGREGFAWGTVYAAHFLTLAGRQVELPPELLDRTLKWLEKKLADRSDSEYDLTTKAYALYVLALNDRFPDGWMSVLKERRDRLAPSGRLFLAGAEALRDGDANALEELEKTDPDLSRRTLNQRVSSFESPSRNLALKLLMWAEVDPLAPITEELALKVAEDGRNKRWTNTQENGWAVLALSAYLVKSGAGEPYRAVLRDPEGRIVFTGDQNQIVALNSEALAGLAGRHLKLEIEGRGRPYHTLTLAGVPLTAPEPSAHKLNLQRTWRLADGQTRRLSTAKDTALPVNVKRGDRIVVELVVEAEEGLQNLVLVDLLPGGFEIENPRFNPAEIPDGRPPAEDQAAEKIPLSTSARLELREDRLVLIEPWVEPGARKYLYTLRAVTPGQYALPGAAAEGMYEPDRKAVLAGGRVIVND